jgi:hypothetical protein
MMKAKKIERRQLPTWDIEGQTYNLDILDNNASAVALAQKIGLGFHQQIKPDSFSIDESDADIIKPIELELATPPLELPIYPANQQLISEVVSRDFSSSDFSSEFYLPLITNIDQATPWWELLSQNQWPEHPLFDSLEWEKTAKATRMFLKSNSIITAYTQDSTALVLAERTSDQTKPESYDLSSVDDIELCCFLNQQELFEKLIGAVMTDDLDTTLSGKPSSWSAAIDRFGHDKFFRQQFMKSAHQAIKHLIRHQERVGAVTNELRRRVSEIVETNDDFKNLLRIIYGGGGDANLAYNQRHSKLCDLIRHQGYKFATQIDGPEDAAQQIISEEAISFKQKSLVHQLADGKEKFSIRNQLQRAQQISQQQQAQKRTYQRCDHQNLLDPGIAGRVEQKTFADPAQLSGLDHRNPEELAPNPVQTRCLLIQHRTQVCRLINDQHFEILCYILEKSSANQKVSEREIATTYNIKLHQVKTIKTRLRKKGDEIKKLLQANSL